MSGILGILQMDGAPVDRQMLEKLAEFQKFRGPDAQGLWIDGNVGFAHSLLKTSDDTALEHQPFQLSDDIWIAADARVDGRGELTAKLTAAGERPAPHATDAELILRSYRAWGVQCVGSIIGDFAFAIWDRPKQRLFCARDHMGVKPFYYAQIGTLLIFSNTLDCIRQHPAVSGRFNDLAIADFLLFDTNLDPAGTAFADICRLPAAHSLTCERGSVSIRRYWAFSVTEPVQFKRESDYIERFRELLDQAVTDRLGTHSAGILMSGGLDSTTVAAAAKRVLTASGDGERLSAHTVVLDDLIPDKERHYATVVARALGIPITYKEAAHCQLFDGAANPDHRPPFPEHSAWPDQTSSLLRQVATRSRVALTGDGGDPCFSSRVTTHFKQLLKRKRFARAASDALGYLCSDGRLSRLYLRARWRLFVNSTSPFSSYPPWLSEEFQAEFGVQDRWRAYRLPDRQACLRRERDMTAVRSEALMAMTQVGWQDLFEGSDPGATRMTVEIRHPFFDLRLADFLLRLSRLPWCSDKELLRRAARGVLPEAVRLCSNRRLFGLRAQRSTRGCLPRRHVGAKAG